MLRHLLAAAVAVVTFTAPASAQLFFSDNFNRTANIAGSTPTPGPGTAYSATVPANVTAATNGTVLQFNNGTLANNGNTFATSTIGNGFTNLSALPRWIQWTFNLRTQATPTGFDNGEFGIATVLAATATDLDAANGYAVVFGRNGTNTVELVRFSGGLDADANMTAIISSGTNPLGAITNFASVRVTYNPVGNNWQLFLRSDGASAFADPITGVTTQIGATTADSTFVGAGNLVGEYYSYGTTDSQVASFDNLTIAAVPEPTTWALIGLSAAGLIGGVYRYRRGAAKTLNTEVDVEENEVA